MRFPIYQVDAFTTRLFGGNPAAVMPLERWLDDALLQSIAMENNVSETAYLVAKGSGYELRWFTPTVEVDLCGHATLAAAHVLWQHLDCSDAQITFFSRGGELRVLRGDDGLTLNFPAAVLDAVNVPVAVCDILGAVASEAMQVSGGPLLLVYEFEDDVARLAPDFGKLQQASPAPVIACAPGDECDFVSRFFAPQVGIDEDPVTGSAHCALVPYWAGRLGQSRLQARQISQRGGDLLCELQEGRVCMTGHAVTFLVGEVML